jgi:hypothetical protein
MNHGVLIEQRHKAALSTVIALQYRGHHGKDLINNEINISVDTKKAPLGRSFDSSFTLIYSVPQSCARGYR